MSGNKQERNETRIAITKETLEKLCEDSTLNYNVVGEMLGLTKTHLKKIINQTSKRYEITLSQYDAVVNFGLENSRGDLPEIAYLSHPKKESQHIDVRKKTMTAEEVGLYNKIYDPTRTEQFEGMSAKEKRDIFRNDFLEIKQQGFEIPINLILLSKIYRTKNTDIARILDELDITRISCVKKDKPSHLKELKPDKQGLEELITRVVPEINSNEFYTNKIYDKSRKELFKNLSHQEKIDAFRKDFTEIKEKDIKIIIKQVLLSEIYCLNNKIFVPILDELGISRKQGRPLGDNQVNYKYFKDNLPHFIKELSSGKSIEDISKETGITHSSTYRNLKKLIEPKVWDEIVLPNKGFSINLSKEKINNLTNENAQLYEIITDQEQKIKKLEERINTDNNPTFDEIYGLEKLITELEKENISSSNEIKSLKVQIAQQISEKAEFKALITQLEKENFSLANKTTSPEVKETKKKSKPKEKFANLRNDFYTKLKVQLESGETNPAQIALDYNLKYAAVMFQIKQLSKNIPDPDWYKNNITSHQYKDRQKNQKEPKLKRERRCPHNYESYEATYGPIFELMTQELDKKIIKDKTKISPNTLSKIIADDKFINFVNNLPDPENKNQDILLRYQNINTRKQKLKNELNEIKKTNNTIDRQTLLSLEDKYHITYGQIVRLSKDMGFNMIRKKRTTSESEPTQFSLLKPETSLDKLPEGVIENKLSDQEIYDLFINAKEQNIPYNKLEEYTKTKIFTLMGIVIRIEKNRDAWANFLKIENPQIELYNKYKDIYPYIFEIISNNRSINEIIKLIDPNGANKYKNNKDVIHNIIDSPQYKKCYPESENYSIQEQTKSHKERKKITKIELSPADFENNFDDIIQMLVGGKNNQFIMHQIKCSSGILDGIYTNEIFRQKVSQYSIDSNINLGDIVKKHLRPDTKVQILRDDLKKLHEENPIREIIISKLTREHCMDRKSVERIVAEFGFQKPPKETIVGKTAIDYENNYDDIIQLLVGGKKNKEIEKEIHISFDILDNIYTNEIFKQKVVEYSNANNIDLYKIVLKYMKDDTRLNIVKKYLQELYDQNPLQIIVVAKLAQDFCVDKNKIRKILKEFAFQKPQKEKKLKEIKKPKIQKPPKEVKQPKEQKPKVIKKSTPKIVDKGVPIDSIQAVERRLKKIGEITDDYKTTDEEDGPSGEIITRRGVTVTETGRKYLHHEDDVNPNNITDFQDRQKYPSWAQQFVVTVKGLIGGKEKVSDSAKNFFISTILKNKQLKPEHIVAILEELEKEELNIIYSEYLKQTVIINP